jgi:hypothetical protein
MRDKPKFNDGGSLTLYFQHESPGKDNEAKAASAGGLGRVQQQRR